ncbi:hypothetical protein CB1_000660005 [Camelus ferus]|nr:hypothetical protein CB1_000660005 [Camelus ferus]
MDASDKNGLYAYVKGDLEIYSEDWECEGGVNYSFGHQLPSCAQIDDKEFDIPQVDTPPTLESILNETDDEDESFVLEDPTLLNIDAIDSHSYDTSSVASSDSGDRTNLKSMMLGVLYTHAFTQMWVYPVVQSPVRSSLGDLPHSPVPWNQNQALRLCLGSTSVGGQYGAISALSINNDCSRLLCGFAKGQILVIGLKPSLKVWMTFPYGRMDPSSVPLLAWHFVAVHNYVNPMLAFCRGDVVHFLLVKRDESGAIHVTKQKHLHLYYDLINFTWINSRTIVLLDSVEKLHVIDRQTQEELETVEISEVQLVYNSSHFKSLATGGNVSQALIDQKVGFISNLLGYDDPPMLCCFVFLFSLVFYIDIYFKELGVCLCDDAEELERGLSGDAGKRKAVVADRVNSKITKRQKEGENPGIWIISEPSDSSLKIDIC